MTSIDWDHRFLNMAALVASWSKDPSTKCGAVIVRPDRTVCSVGFNGFPRWVEDRQEWLEDREEKYQRIIHAEVNAVLSAGEVLTGYTMYTWPPGVGPTCDRCATVVIQAGISRVVHVRRQDDSFSSRWSRPALVALEMYQQAGVVVNAYTLNDFDIHRWEGASV